MKTIDELEGVGSREPIQALWTRYNWTEARGLKSDRKLWKIDEQFGLIRIDKGKNLDGWWAIDDLIKTAGGPTTLRHSGWYMVPHVGLQRAKVIVRMLGLDHRLEICENPENFPEGYNFEELRNIDQYIRQNNN